LDPFGDALLGELVLDKRVWQRAAIWEMLSQESDERCGVDEFNVLARSPLYSSGGEASGRNKDSTSRLL